MLVVFRFGSERLMGILFYPWLNRGRKCAPDTLKDIILAGQVLVTMMVLQLSRLARMNATQIGAVLPWYMMDTIAGWKTFHCDHLQTLAMVPRGLRCGGGAVSC